MLRYCVLFFVLCVSNAFRKINNGITTLHNLYTINPNRLNYLDITNNIKNKIIQKTQGSFKLIRPCNIVPTLLLCISSKWIVNPSFIDLIKSTQFIAATAITLLIMSASMVINDLFDIEIDKVNNPTRPLITGEITKTEAIVLSSVLLSITEILSFYFLSKNLQIITKISTINIIMYTPIFKKIPIIKNISCASIIAFTVIFTGLASSTQHMSSTKIEYLISFVRLLFFGSLYNEIILDIRDYEGDKQNNINTIPVLFGKDISLSILFIIANVNILWNTFAIYKLYGFKVACILPILCNDLFVNIYCIKKHNYSTESLIHAVDISYRSLYSILLYLCIIAKMKPL